MGNANKIKAANSIERTLTPIATTFPVRVLASFPPQFSFGRISQLHLYTFPAQMTHKTETA